MFVYFHLQLQSVVEIWHFSKWDDGDFSEFGRCDVIFQLFCGVLDVHRSHRHNLSPVFRCYSYTWSHTLIHGILCTQSSWSHRNCWCVSYFDCVHSNTFLSIVLIHLSGYICCTITVLFFAAPCCMLMDVFRKKSTDMLPLPLILMSFIGSVQWFAFGLIANDLFLQIPNLLGAMLSGTQLALFCVYPNKIRSSSAATSSSEVPYAIF